jgi:hypothetical protein
MYNIRQITNNSLKNFETVVIEGVPYAIIPASYLGEGIVKLGFCLTNPADFGSSFFITVNEKQFKIKVGKTGIYEINVDSYYDKNQQKRLLNPIITDLKLPKNVAFSLDYVTYKYIEPEQGEEGGGEEDPMAEIKGKNIQYWTPEGGWDIGDIIIYDSNLYTCIVPNSSNIFDANEWDKIGGEVEHYVLPTASTEVLGGIKVGENLSIDENGVLNAEEYTLPKAEGNTLGGVKIGTGINVSEDGTISVEQSESQSGGEATNISFYTPLQIKTCNKIFE